MAGFFREAFSLTIRTVGSLDRVTGDGVVLRVAEAQATEHGLGQVRAALDQAIATANRRSTAHIEGLNAELDDKARRDTQDAQKLRAIQDILDKQNGEP